MDIQNRNPADDAELTELIENVLNNLCIPPCLLGYFYLTHAIRQVVLDRLCLFYHIFQYWFNEVP